MKTQDTRGHALLRPRVLGAYRAFHEQGFVPIFTDDGLDSKMLVEAAVEAGCRVLEYTLRRRDADRMIPWIRENFPDVYLLAGSTLDDDAIVEKQRRLFPQLRTVAELAEMGVDGFVSMIGWREEKIRAYAPAHLVIPCAMTLTEAFQAMGAGAHFVKLNGPDLSLVKTCRAEATHGFCPVFVTGGIFRERIPETFAAGAIAVGTGVDLLLKNETNGVSQARVVETLKSYLEVTRSARQKAWPMLAGPEADEKRWLESLPHYHPF